MTAVSEVPLLTLNGKEDRRFTLYASSAGKAEREGETTLWLRDSDHTLLASATFSVTRDHDAWQLVIGGLQGPRRHVSHEVIKQATRACYGLFRSACCGVYLAAGRAQPNRGYLRRQR